MEEFTTIAVSFSENAKSYGKSISVLLLTIASSINFCKSFASAYLTLNNLEVSFTECMSLPSYFTIKVDSPSGRSGTCKVILESFISSLKV